MRPSGGWVGQPRQESRPGFPPHRGSPPSWLSSQGGRASRSGGWGREAGSQLEARRNPGTWSRGRGGKGRSPNPAVEDPSLPVLWSLFPEHRPAPQEAGRVLSARRQAPGYHCSHWIPGPAVSRVPLFRAPPTKVGSEPPCCALAFLGVNRLHCQPILVVEVVGSHLQSLSIRAEVTWAILLPFRLPVDQARADSCPDPVRQQ